MDSDFKTMSEKLETLKRVERSAEIVDRKEEPRSNYQVSNHKQQVVTRNEQELAFKCWALKASGNEQFITSRHIEASQKTGINVNNNSFTYHLSDNANESQVVSRNQSSGINSEGGYLNNDGVFVSLERNLKWFGGVYQASKTIRTDNGEPLSYAYGDDTANVGVRLGQNTAVANSSLTYSKKTLGCYDYSSGVFPGPSVIARR